MVRIPLDNAFGQQARIGFEALGAKAVPFIPELVKMLDPAVCSGSDLRKGLRPSRMAGFGGRPEGVADDFHPVLLTSKGVAAQGQGIGRGVSMRSPQQAR